jgi:hypothetical protein
MCVGLVVRENFDYSDFMEEKATETMKRKELNNLHRDMAIFQQITTNAFVEFINMVEEVET